MNRVQQWTAVGFLFLSALLLASFSRPALAESDPAQQWQVTEETLPNGLSVLLLEDHRAPVVSLQVWYKVGARNERLGITGISHLLEHLMFRGTPQYGPGEFSKLIQSTGGTENAFTSDDQTVYFANTAAPHVGLLLTLEADRMVNLNLDETGFQSERKIVMEERRLRTADQPASDLWEQVSAAAYTAHPYGWPVVGWMSDLESLTLEQVKQYRHIYYAPNNAILIIAGDVNPATLLPQIRSTFGPAEAGTPPPQVTAKEPPQRGERRVVLKRPAALPIYMAAYHVPNYTNDDSFALSMLSIILAGGRSSRLQTILVEQKTLALSADAEYDRTSHDPGLFFLSMRVASGKKWQDAEAALYQEVEKLKNTPVSEKELQRAQNLVEAAFIYGQDSLFFRAQQLGEYAVLGDWRLIQKVIPGIRAVTTTDLQRVAQTYLREENRTVGILIPEGAPIRERPAGELSDRTLH
jgi:zinc protease